MARWDWYQSTVMVSDPQESGLVSVLLEAWPESDWTPAANLNGYTHGGAIRRGGRILCHLCWGGQLGVNCKATSDESPALADALRKFGKHHMPTRVDTCEDWHEEGLFDSLSSHLVKFAQDNRLAINQQGDWIRGEARTLYIGSKDSPVRLVIYEKSAERAAAGFLGVPEHWVRLEARIRPKREHRAAVALWEPINALEAGWIPAALEAVGFWHDLSKRSVGTVWRCSDEERARAALLKQYGAVMARWALEVGSWDALGPAIDTALKDQARGALGTIAKSASPPTGDNSPADRAATLQAG